MKERIKHPIPIDIRPYLNEIAERLWSGHAAVMVGAGFSKNAKPNSTSAPDFPDWSQLGDLLYEKIHGKKPGTNSKYLNVLKLADEVHAAFGRPVLDQLLRDAIPNQDYEPSPIHEKLLKLPWSDVFTTNYDTLLERSRNAVKSRRYEVIVNKEDLTLSQKPRIIKLHGSFPSGPFVITEEDYRRYPEKFAPFVNTVQQALLENTLCLVGFSGDDPNFLQWIGWIRDNLGQLNSPKIYLIGVFRLSDAEKKLLEQRNIVLINMSICPGINENHYKALERFLDFLHSRKEEDKSLGWPWDSKLFHPDTKKDKITQLSHLLVVWEKQRLLYPGWVIVPEDRRSVLWKDTFSWLHYLSATDNLPDFIDLKFAFELSWRMEKCLYPIISNQLAFFETILEKYLPRLSVEAPIDSFQMDSDDIKLEESDRNEMREMLHNLQLWLLRFFREEGLLEKWQNLCEEIQQNVEILSPENKANFQYERGLYALFGLNVAELNKILTEWQVNESLPFWEAKRAGLLAEIGQVDEAKKILEQSLNGIRSKLNLKPITSDYSLVSQESFVMLLLQYVQTSVANKTVDWSGIQELQKNFSERWNALNQYKCDPWHELKIFESALKQPPVKQSNVREKKEFDIGRVTRTIHYGSGDKEASIAYNFLRFCEDAGIPFRIPWSTFGIEAAKGTLSRISESSPYWAMATMVRIGDDKVVDHIFNRASLSQMQTTSVDSLIERYLKCLEQSEAGISTGRGFLIDNFEKVLAKVVPEILSRLCCKCSAHSRNRLFDFLLNVYGSKHRGKYGEIRNLTERLMSAFSPEQRFDLIPRLLDFPIVEYANHIEERNFTNPFQFLNLGRSLTETSAKPILLEGKENNLLEMASSDRSYARKWAIITLGKLYFLGQLKQGQKNKFAEALWSILDDYGLPTDTDYYKFAFLEMPHPPSVEPISLFKNYVHSEQFPIQKNSENRTISGTRGDIPLCAEIVGASKRIDWSEDDVKSIIDRLIEWWEADKEYLQTDHPAYPFGSVVGEFKARFARLVEVLVAVTSPDFPLSGENHRKKILRRVIDELHDYGIPTLRLQSACLHLYPSWRNDVFERIENGMTSSSHETVIDSLESVLVIAERTKSAPDKEHFSRISQVLAQMIRWQKITGLPQALYTMKKLIRKYPWAITGETERLTLMGLRYIAKDTATKANGLDFANKLEIRRAAAGLAYGFSEYYSKQRSPVPDVIAKWRAICLSESEFAEVRNQWIR